MLNIDNLKNRGNNLSLDLQVRNIIRRQSLANNGVWYDPSDLSTLFQDAAGSIPVTAAGQPVGKILDKSGRGNHATQSTAGFKPLYQAENGLGYLSFDGVDDFLVAGNVDFSSSDKIAVAAGGSKSSPNTAILVELSPNANNYAGSFYLTFPDIGDIAGFRVAGELITPKSISYIPALASGSRYILSGEANISADVNKIRRNGVQVDSKSVNLGAVNFANYPLYIGRRGGTSLPFNGRLYGLAICGGMDDIYKLKKIEQYLAQKTGVII